MVRKTTTLMLVFLAFFYLGRARNLEDRIHEYENFVEKQMKVDRVPGLSVAFMKGDYLWAKGFGYSDLENRVLASEVSSYRLASITKTMTAVAILQLMEKGKLKLDDEARKYVPYFPEKKWPVTIRDLLGHLAGISHYRSYPELHIKTHKDTREAIAIFSEFNLVAKPGTEFHYSSYGYNLLGAVVEGASKMPYGKYMKENIWEPLGMKNTCMDSPDEVIPHRVRGYRIVEGKLKNSEFVDMSSRFAAGGTRSTVVDLLKFIRGIRDGKVLKPETVEKMFTSMVTSEGYLTDYGMGWMLKPRDGHFIIYHSGAQAETRTLLVYIPSEDLAVAFGCNLENANPYLYGFRLVQVLLEEPWGLGAYTGDEKTDLVYYALEDSFNYGLSYFERYKKPLTEDPEELKKAFSYFSNYASPSFVSKNYRVASEKIKKGRHPIAGKAFIKVGSFVAWKLSKAYGGERMDFYHRNGAIPFFEDYLKLCNSQRELCGGLTLSSELEKLIKKWGKDWKRTLNDDTRTLFIGAFSDFSKQGKVLKRIFSGASIYPDFTGQLTEATKKLYLNGDRRSLIAAELSLQLYPDSARALSSLANAYVAFGEIEKAMELYRKAMKAKTHKSAVSPGAIFSYIFDFYDAGNLKAALGLAKIATKLYPSEAKFYRAIGDIYLKRARKYYQRSLEVDPNYEYPWKMLKKLDIHEF